MEATALRIGRTPSGVKYGIVGKETGGPAPLLLQLAGPLEDSLTNPDFCLVSDLLVEQGWRAFSVDVPGHGEDVRKGETDWDLKNWRKRIEAGDDLVSEFIQRGSVVLDHLIAEGIADPQRIAAAGSSRGGFCALHFAAGDGRPRWVCAMTPQTNPTLNQPEFEGLEYNALARSLAVHNLAEKLVGKSVWLCIGNDDKRVGTDSSIAFTRRLVEANKCQGVDADVELHVLGFAGHSTRKADHEAAAAWLSAKVNLGNSDGYRMLTLR